MENLEEMKRLITELVSLRKEIVRVEDEINKEHVNLQNIRKELQAICPHTETKAETKTYSGGYLHKGSYVTKHICIVCQLEVNEKIEEGSFE